MGDGEASEFRQFRIRLRRRWIALRNAVIGSPSFQGHAARNPFLRPVARRRSAALFDLVAGFAYTQILRATVEAGLIDLLARGPIATKDIAAACEMQVDAAQRLLRSAQALELVEDVGDECWMLGEQGAALHANPGAQAMIRHHALLYRDLAEPLELLRNRPVGPTHLSRFWDYANPAIDAGEYSALMASSQEMVADQVIVSGVLKHFDTILDVGGGLGVFAGKVLAQYPDKRVGIFDLPEVLSKGSREAEVDSAAGHLALHPGNFFTDPLPAAYQCITLVRILHDHDDDKAIALLRAVHAALPPGGTLVIAEPMAGVAGAERMGEAYFGLYLWAMQSGRPRRTDEIGTMIEQAGFRSWRKLGTNLPVITSLIVAIA
ncbi:methyltransferase [Qipengyuania sp.]|uniref:methyltransferase n=1 Tax=Qipengyuania sp. TaxID=2004515 RepID=UPI003AF6A4C6